MTESRDIETPRERALEVESEVVKDLDVDEDEGDEVRGGHTSLTPNPLR
jgi:hypothetical protein